MSASFRPARLLARAARGAATRLGRSGGTTAPGRLLLRLSPDALGRMARELDDGCIAISATNGKTTTAAMIAAALEADGRPLVHNRAGSNMAWGVATALLDARRGRGQLGLFEVDEAWLGEVARAAEPKLYLLANLFRDQLDRYGELELLADRWAEIVAAHDERAGFVLNADDPLVADLGRGRRDVVYFGLEDDSQALSELQHAADSKHCRNCGHAYAYEAIYLGHMGRYRCPSCGRARPEPQVAATRVELRGMEGSRVELRTPAGPLTLELPLPGLYNVYNAVGAVAMASKLGVPLETIGSALTRFAPAFGRVETVQLGGHPVSILLIKNPAGANEVLRTVTLEAGQLDLWIALNDRIADGRDVSWVWDADFELLAGRVRRVTCSGTRAEEMALRLKYAGVDAELVVDRELERSLDAAVAAAPGQLFALPTYTALLDLHAELVRRGVSKPWSES
jgi:lipid II isoglutaminyl synthase (glutamine-hydrolysing)